jgi:hypothetical protein
MGPTPAPEQGVPLEPILKSLPPYRLMCPQALPWPSSLLTVPFPSRLVALPQPVGRQQRKSLQNRTRSRAFSRLQESTFYEDIVIARLTSRLHQAVYDGLSDDRLYLVGGLIAATFVPDMARSPVESNQYFEEPNCRN